MINIIKSALSTSSHKMSVISNNIANSGTNGFKRSEATFEDIFYFKPCYESGANNVNMKWNGTSYDNVPAKKVNVGQGSRVTSNRVSHNPAPVKQSGVSSDLAVNGHGMFVLAPAPDRLTSDELMYTRNGSFQLDENGYLTSHDGMFVLAANNTGSTTVLEPIQVDYFKSGIPLSEFTVSPEGYVMTSYGKGSLEAGKRIGLASFDNPQGLTQMGEGKFGQTVEASLYGIFGPGEGNAGKVLPGHIEVSNVDIVKELVALIQAQQSFAAASKAIQTDNNMIARMLN